MPGEINRYPHGLLSAFDLKTQGETPRFLAPTVQVTWDGMPFYIADRERSWAAVQNAYNGPNGFVTTCAVTVPDNEIWYIRQAMAKCTNAAPGEYSLAVGLFSATRLAGSFYLGPVGLMVKEGATLAAQQIYAWAPPFWAYPGDQIGVLQAERTTATADIETRGLYVPFTR